MLPKHKTHPHRRIIIALAACALLGLAAALPGAPANVQAFADHKAEGAELYANSGCAHCHGATGKGAEKGPALTNVRRKLTEVQMHKQIAEGGVSMPAFGDSLNPEQIDNVIAALRDKHQEKLLAAHPAKP